jgi:hypothetical protein
LLVLESLACDGVPNLIAGHPLAALDRATVGQVLRQLTRDGLARKEPDGSWRPTDLGVQARQHGEYSRAGCERRTFYFLESRLPGHPPSYLNLKTAATMPWPAATDWTFDVQRLTDCVHQPADWKQSHGFPAEVEEVLQPGEEVLRPEAGRANTHAGPTQEANAWSWRRVILDQPEHLVIALIQALGPQGGNRLLGFAAHPSNWSLQLAAPALDITTGARELFAEMAGEPSLDQWRQVWKVWGEANGLNAAEMDACTLQRRDHRLRVVATRPLIERLRPLRPEVFKGEVWLLGGEDRYRAAAVLEIIDTASQGGGVSRHR